MAASPMSGLTSGSPKCSSADVRSCTAAPRSILSCTWRGIGLPSLACWAAIPRRIAVHNAGGYTAAYAVGFAPVSSRPCSTA
eukprot:15101312-Alexandrium_andersonii.AAC.1